MRRLLVLLAATTVVFASVGTISNRAQAAIPSGFGERADGLVLVDQFRWRGHRYCWYNRGWRGAGWYRCGFQWRRGSGWGGPAGWHGWRRPGHGPVVRPRPPSHRPPSHRPPSGRPPQRPVTLPANVGPTSH